MNSKRRSLLFVPADSEKFIRKAVSLPRLDAVILDLEDGVSPDRKQQARDNLCRAVEELHDACKEVFVRINDIASLRGIEDLLHIVTLPPHLMPEGVLIPKATERSVTAADAVIAAAQGDAHTPFSLGILLMIETAYSLSNIRSILSASCRIQGLVFGAEDYTNDLDVEKEQAKDMLLYAKCTAVNWAKACNIDAFDTPCTDFKNPEVYLSEIAQAKKLGFSGKTCIHPVMVDAVNDSFSPSPQQISRAKLLLEAYEEGIRQHKGAVSFEGKMIDLPIVQRAKKILQKAGELSDS